MAQMPTTSRRNTWVVRWVVISVGRSEERERLVARVRMRGCAVVEARREPDREIEAAETGREERVRDVDHVVRRRSPSAFSVRERRRGQALDLEREVDAAGGVRRVEEELVVGEDARERPVRRPAGRPDVCGRVATAVRW